MDRVYHPKDFLDGTWAHATLDQMPKDYTELLVWPAAQDDPPKRTLAAIEASNGELFVTVRDAKEQLLQLFRVNLP